MNQNIKTAILSALIAAVVASFISVGVTLVGNQSANDQFGLGVTRYPNSGIVAQYFAASSTSATSSFAGPLHTAQLVQGGTVVSATASTTLTGSQMCNMTYYTVSNVTGAATTTLTLPSSTVNTCLTSNGDWKQITIFNNSTTTLIFATSTNSILSATATSTATATLINGTATISLSPNLSVTSTYPWGILTLIRTGATTTTYLLSRYNFAF